MSEPEIEEVRPGQTRRVGKLRKSILWIGIAIVVAVVISVSVLFLFPGQEESAEQKELDFTISGKYPEVGYIAFRTGADERWNLTIECLEMPNELAWAGVLQYDGYWNKGSGHKTSANSIYGLANELTQLAKIGADPEIQQKYPGIAPYNTTVYSHIYGTSTDQSFTVFFGFPDTGKGEFHVTLKKLE